MPTIRAWDLPAKSFPQILARQNIVIRHPGYPNRNLLLKFPRVDSAVSVPDDDTYGVHHRTVLLACQIIAGNVFTNSYLSLDKEGQQRVPVPVDGILMEHEYYFIVEGNRKDYPLSSQSLLQLY